jgi:hypothetical protein
MSYFRNIANLIETIQTEGKYQGKDAKVFHILGRRAGFTSTSILNDIKEFDNAVAAIPVYSNASLDILSSSVNDTNTAGTGVRQVKVVYINNSGALVESAAINLNGTTLVTNVLSAVDKVLWMEAVSVGSNNVAVGNIRLRINGGTVEVEQITVGGNKSLSAQFRVPTNYTGYLVQWDNESINSDQDIKLRAMVNSLDRSLSTVFHFMGTMYLQSNTRNTEELGMLKIPALADIKVSTVSSGTASINRVNTSVIIIIIAN